MPRFWNKNDIDFFKVINNELVEDVIETPIVLYKLLVGDTMTNIYGESDNSGKSWRQGVQVYCLIEHDRQTTEYEGFGPDTNQLTRFRFARYRLETAEIFPEVGDVISWDGAYWEISNVVDNQLIGNQTDTKFSIVAECFPARNSSLDIEERNA